MNNMRVIAYEDSKKGVYKYAIVKDSRNAVSELQRFIKAKKIDLDIKVDIRDVTIPERERVQSMTISPDKAHEIIVFLRGKDGVTIFSEHPVINHDLPNFINWLVNWKDVKINDIYEMSLYTNGLCDTIEISPYTWAGTDTALLAVDEK